MDQWIKIKDNENCWDSEIFYVHKSQEIAKVYRSKCVHWGYHDESEYETEEEIISIENALKLVYPDKVAIYKMLQYTKGDYSEVLEELFGTKEYLSELSEIGLLLQKEEKKKRVNVQIPSKFKKKHIIVTIFICLAVLCVYLLTQKHNNTNTNINTETSVKKYTILSVDEIHDTKKTEKFKVSGKSYETENIHVYIFGKDQNGDDIIILFEHRNSKLVGIVENLENQEKFYEKVEKFLDEIETTEGGVIFEGTSQRINFKEHEPIVYTGEIPRGYHMVLGEEAVNEMNFLNEYNGKLAIVPEI